MSDFRTKERVTEMTDCKHEFVYDELRREHVCKKCGYVLTKEDKMALLEYANALRRAEEDGDG